MSPRSPEARYAVYLVDPGPDRRGVVRLLQEVLGVNAATAAECLREFPALVSYCATEEAARALSRRFREFDAVAVVRPADQPLAPAPVEPVGPGSLHRSLSVALVILSVIQLGIAYLWLQEGRALAAFFGAVLGIYVLLAFAPRIRRQR